MPPGPVEVEYRREGEVLVNGHDPEGCDANLDALRAEVARLSGLLDEAGTRYESMRERRNRAREHAVAAERERDELRTTLSERTAQLDRARREWDERAGEGQGQVAALVADNQTLRHANIELTTERDAARRIATSAGRDLDDLRRRLDRAGVTDAMLVEGEQHGWLVVPPNMLPGPATPVELRVDGPGVVTYDGKLLRIDYDGDREGEAEGVVVTEAATSPQLDRRPSVLDDDPRRPRLDSWPDDAVTLTYHELRNLVALHLRAADSSVLTGSALARAVCDGEVPLRVSEVLDR
jgi:hypothetical protein